MKVAVFVVEMRVENFDEDSLNVRARLMGLSGVVAVRPAPESNYDMGAERRKAEGGNSNE